MRRRFPGAAGLGSVFKDPRTKINVEVRTWGAGESLTKMSGPNHPMLKIYIYSVGKTLFKNLVISIH